jgi:hypothetical protein
MSKETSDSTLEATAEKVVVGGLRSMNSYHYIGLQLSRVGSVHKCA